MVDGADTDQDTLYRIGDVVRLTGVPAATVRFWESRHGLLAPRRTKGGFRLYTLQDVQTVQEIRGRCGVSLQTPRDHLTDCSSLSGGVGVRRARNPLPTGSPGIETGRIAANGQAHAVSADPPDPFSHAATSSGDILTLTSVLAATLVGRDAAAVPQDVADHAVRFLRAEWCGIVVFDSRSWHWSGRAPARARVDLYTHPLLRDDRLWAELNAASTLPTLSSLYSLSGSGGGEKPNLRLRVAPIVVEGEIKAALCVCERSGKSRRRVSTRTERHGMAGRSPRSVAPQQSGLVSGGPLTGRETEVLELLAGGKGSKEIALLLSVTDKTVRNHLSSIYRKLHVYDRVQAILYAAREGLVQLGPEQRS